MSGNAGVYNLVIIGIILAFLRSSVLLLYRRKGNTSGHTSDVVFFCCSCCCCDSEFTVNGDTEASLWFEMVQHQIFKVGTLPHSQIRPEPSEKVKQKLNFT